MTTTACSCAPGCCTATEMWPRLILDFAARLQFPQLFLVTLGLFVLDLLIPDVIPFADEILLGLVTLIAASIRKKTPVGGDGGRVFENEGDGPPPPAEKR